MPHPLLRLLAALALLAVTLPPAPSRAADIRLIDSPLCRISLSGQIMAGDTERLRAVVQELQDRGIWRRAETTGEWRLCLDSPGGSLAEGARLAEFVFETGIGTVLAPNAQCLSACAWIFMLGFEQGYEDLFFTNRRMHYTARLGFHAPSLPIEEVETISRADAQRAMATLNQAVALLLRLSNSLILGTRPAIDIDLLEEAFAHDGEEIFFEIDTVDKAGRWRIDVFGLTWPSEIDIEAAAWACTSLTRWPAGRNETLVNALGVADVTELLRYTGANPSGAALQVPGLDSGYFDNRCRISRSLLADPLGEAMVRACGINESRDVRLGRSENCLDGPEDQSALRPYPAIAIFPPETRLRDLPEAARQIAARAATAPRAASDPQLHRSCWPDAQRMRITRVNEYATLRARPGFDAPIRARMPLHAQVELTGSPVLFGDQARMNACRTACQAAGTARNRPAPDVAACWLDNTLWFPARFEGQEGYVSGRFLAE